MVRITVIFLLFLSFLFLIRGLTNSWRENPIPPPPVTEEGQPPIPDIQSPIDLSSPVPRPLPDLHKGYVFNVDRLFEEKVEPETGDAKEGKSIDDDIYLDIDSVTYTGSIISASAHKAIVSYSPAQPRGFSARRRSTLGARRTSSRTVAPSSIKYATLETGDVFNGYKVISIDPEKIVFERDDEKIEKFLYDPEKKRLPTTPSRPVAERTAPDQAAARAALAPAVNRRVVVGQPSSAVEEEAGPRTGVPRRPPRARQIIPPVPNGGRGTEVSRTQPRRRPRVMLPPQTSGQENGNSISEE